MCLFCNFHIFQPIFFDIDVFSTYIQRCETQKTRKTTEMKGNKIKRKNQQTNKTKTNNNKTNKQTNKQPTNQLQHRTRTQNNKHKKNLTRGINFYNTVCFSRGFLTNQIKPNQSKNKPTKPNKTKQTSKTNKAKKVLNIPGESTSTIRINAVFFVRALFNKPNQTKPNQTKQTKTKQKQTNNQTNNQTIK